jgi:radical SAM protein with 4Fe4S-binding SPASM domain
MTGYNRRPWFEPLALARRLTPRRLLNGLRLLSSFYYARYTGRPSAWGRPLSFAVEPTTACNLGCPECPSGLRAFSRPTGMLQPERFRGIVDQMAPHALYLTLYFQGEPYLNPSFFEFVEYARRKKLYTATSTNGHYLTPAKAEKTIEAGLNRLIISIDGTTQDTYASYRRRGSLEKVLRGTDNILEARRRLGRAHPQIIWQFLVVRPNEHQTEEVVRMARARGVDELRFKTAQVYDYEHGNPLIPTKARFSRYRRMPDGTYAIKNKLLNHCWRMWQACVFTWDGRVVPCCFDKDATHVFGQVPERPFAEVWRNEAYQSFRAALLRGRKEIDICRNCTEGTKIWA